MADTQFVTFNKANAFFVRNARRLFISSRNRLCWVVQWTCDLWWQSLKWEPCHRLTGGHSGFLAAIKCSATFPRLQPSKVGWHDRATFPRLQPSTVGWHNRATFPRLQPSTVGWHTRATFPRLQPSTVGWHDRATFPRLQPSTVGWHTRATFPRLQPSTVGWHDRATFPRLQPSTVGWHNRATVWQSDSVSRVTSEGTYEKCQYGVQKTIGREACLSNFLPGLTSFET